MSSDAVFVLFGASHVLTIATIAAVALALPLAVRRPGAEPLARRAEIALAVFLAAHELYRIGCWIWVYDRPLREHLPLQLCGLAVFLSAYMLVHRSYRAFELVYFWGFGGTLQAILTPDLDVGFPHPQYVGYFVSHGLIMVCALYAVLVFRFRPTWGSLGRVYLLTVVYAFGVIAPLNYLLDTNYLYLCGKPLGASLLDYLGPWPWYLGSLAVVAWLSFLLYYLPFLAFDLVNRRQQRDTMMG